MSNNDNHVSDDDYPGDNRSQESARDITDRLLQSRSALEALGRGLLPALSSLMSQRAAVHGSSAGPSSATVSQVSQVSSNIPSTHVQQPFQQPFQPFNPQWYPSLPIYGHEAMDTLTISNGWLPRTV